MTKNIQTYIQQSRFHIILCLSAVFIPVGLTTSLPAIAKSNVAIKPRVDLVVEGQIFIVTNGQQAIKLALVPIAVVSEQEINQLLSLRSKRMNQRRDEIAVELSAAVEKREMLKVTREARQLESREVGKKSIECAMTLSSTAPDYKTEFAKCSNKPEMIAARVRAEELHSELYGARVGEDAAEAEENIVKLLTQYNSGTSITDIYDELARAVPALTKSDIDGKFGLGVPSGKRYAVLAHASRYIGGSGDEQYRWLIWLSAPTAGIKTQIMLANDNLILSPACKECTALNEHLTVHPEVAILFQQLATGARFKGK